MVSSEFSLAQGIETDRPRLRPGGSGRSLRARSGAPRRRRRPVGRNAGAPNLTPAPRQFLLRDNRVVKKTSRRPTRKKRPDGVIEWCSADGILFKTKSPRGQTIWYDAEGRFHRDDGPAVEGPDGTIWLQHGKEHREGAPAIEDSTGKYWFRYGKKHRDDGPAVERADGRTEWWRNDRRLKLDQIRAIMKRNGDKAAEPFLTGLDHEVTLARPMKLKKP
jgi:hypothetical protein